MKQVFIFIYLLFLATAMQAKDAKAFLLTKNDAVTLYCHKNEALVVQTALNLFRQDYVKVLAASPRTESLKKARIVVGTIDNPEIAAWAAEQGICLDGLQGKHEGFLLKVLGVGNKYRLAVLGSDKRGTAYGLMTLVRMMGVSPWQWWADCEPTPREVFQLEADFERLEVPSVAYRGIFINDEDWGLNPWSSNNYEPKMRQRNGEDSTPRNGEIGPYTHERIFELLLRLRANIFWPAMHECTVPFYLIKGNREMADKYGILISTSHCEPMMRNTNGEWRKAGLGDYNFVTNAKQVVHFWEERVKELSGSDCLYTLGMRGVHDSAMEGAKTIPEQVKVLTDVLKVQRDLLAMHVNAQVDKVPQQFIPYKEVLDCYHSGLQVPDDVTLIWCDDNYGYIRHFPTEQERTRKGGHGMYYHASYWGRPHDYLWLATTPPELIHAEMQRAYRHGVDKVWVLNVGDIKPAEYLISLFVDMAWEGSRFGKDKLGAYMARWYEEQLGMEGKELLPLWKTYYDLSFKLRPEFLGGTRTEEKDPKYKLVSDVPMNEKEITERLSQCREMIDAMNRLEKRFPQSRLDAWFQLVKYPLSAMAAMNEKMLGAQLARHRLAKWDKPLEAFNHIVTLTEKYNALKDGKWEGIMSWQPRNLPVFAPVKEEYVDAPLTARTNGKLVFQSDLCIGTELLPGKDISCLVETANADSLVVEIRTLPVHPTNGNVVRYRLQLDNEQPIELDFHTEGRSEEWKRNVLYNYASRMVKLPLHNKKRECKLTVTAVDEGVFVQEIVIH